MSLLDPPAAKPDKSRAMAFTIAALTLVAVVALWFTFRYYPEKKAAERFFDALVAGDMAQAYQLWKPGPSYTMNDFLADWGPQGYYGPVKSYVIERARGPRGSTSVAITVKVSPYSTMPDVSDAEKSRKTRVVEVWIQPSDKSFSFPPP
jgi:hypothetical protein